MSTYAERLRLRLATGPKSGTQMAKDMGISQPTATRALAAMGDEVMKIGQTKARAMRCATRAEVLVMCRCFGLMLRVGSKNWACSRL